MTQPAAETGGVCAIAVQLDDLVVRHAGALMQPVDILGDHARTRAFCDKPGYSPVPPVGPRRAHRAMCDKLAAPRLAAHFLRSEEILEVDRRHARPHAAGTAKIGDTGFRADARASEAHRTLGGADQFGESGGGG